MRTSIITGALLASLAVANPVKRAEVVHVDVVTQVVVVTSTKGLPGPSAPTAAPQPAPAKLFVVKPAPAASPAPAPKPVVAPKPVAAPKPADAPKPVAPAPKPAPATSGSAPSDFKGSCLFHHNQHRANHSAPALDWSESLAAAAEKIAATCVFKHEMNVDGLKYGQNIANGNTASNIGKTISDQFYNGEFGFMDNYGSPSLQAPFAKVGHLTQIVWKNTKEVGCAVATCSDQAGNSYTVCNYGPPGMILPSLQRSSPSTY